MTEQEYLYEIWNNNRINTQGKVDCDALVKQIHKDFESRTCENCKWYDGSHKCNNENSIAHETDNRVYTYDGCKEDWEKRNDN